MIQDGMGKYQISGQKYQMGPLTVSQMQGIFPLMPMLTAEAKEGKDDLKILTNSETMAKLLSVLLKKESGEAAVFSAESVEKIPLDNLYEILEDFFFLNPRFSKSLITFVQTTLNFHLLGVNPEAGRV